MSLIVFGLHSDSFARVNVGKKFTFIQIWKNNYLLTSRRRQYFLCLIKMAFLIYFPCWVRQSGAASRESTFWLWNELEMLTKTELCSALIDYLWTHSKTFIKSPIFSPPTVTCQLCVYATLKRSKITQFVSIKPWERNFPTKFIRFLRLRAIQERSKPVWAIKITYRNININITYFLRVQFYQHRQMECVLFACSLSCHVSCMNSFWKARRWIHVFVSNQFTA